jgi:hypothetical protein
MQVGLKSADVTEDFMTYVFRVQGKYEHETSL